MIKSTTIGFITVITTSLSINYPAYATDATTGTSTAGTSTTATSPNVVGNTQQNNSPATTTLVPAPATVAPQSGTTNLPKKDTNRKPPINKKETETWTNKLKDKWKEREKEQELNKAKQRSQEKTDKHEKSTK